MDALAHERNLWPVAAWQPAFSCACAIAAPGSLLAAGGWLLLRRLGGAFAHPPSGAALFAAAMVALALAVCARWLSLSSPRLSIWMLPTLGLAMLAAALLPGQRATSIVLVLSAIVAEEAWAWFVIPPWGAKPVRSTSLPAGRQESVPAPVSQSPAQALSADVTHQLVRTSRAGLVEISGVVRAAFTSGQRTAIEHVPFCPPLASAPQVEVSQVSGPAARIKATHVLPQGARIEIRLASAAATPVAVELHWNAREMASSGR